METERKALYNALRQNWLRDPTLKVESWQVENLRDVPLETLFDKIQEAGLPFDKETFHFLANEHNTPEEMADAILADLDLEQENYDKVYLALFELWRRLVPEKQTLTIFCDELDYQIHLYDVGEIKNFEAFQDSINDLLEILNENVDSGVTPEKALKRVSEETANNIEEFLYDYFSDEIDQGHYSYVSDLVEGFYPYVADKRWFDLLKMRIQVENEGEDLDSAINGLQKKIKGNNLEFLFELLTFLSKRGDSKTYYSVAKKILGLFEVEEDLVDFLTLTADFYHFHDNEIVEKQFLELLKKRNKPLDSPFKSDDPILSEIKKILV